MELHDAMLSRRSIRKFTEQKVDDELIDRLLQYGMSGPSACNRQPWEFYVVTNEQKLEELRKLGHFTNYQSPLNIVVAGNLRRALPMQLAEFWVQDCSAAVENILLGATSMGLGACWCGIKPGKRLIVKAQKILQIEDHIEPLGLLHIGYPAEQVEPRTQYNKKRIHIID